MKHNDEIQNKLNLVISNQEKINSLLKISGLTSHRFLIDGKDFDQSLKVNDIQLITTSENGLTITDSLGCVFYTKPSVSISDIEKYLLSFPQFVRTHEKFLVNLNHVDYFSPSPTEPQGRTITFKNSKSQALLSSYNSQKVKNFFNTKTLEHVEPWNEQYQAIIDENLRSFDKEIRFMTSDELKNNFKYSSTGEFNIREFMANMIWEYYNLLLIGKRDPIEGNIRTFWYYLKPTLSKAISINSLSQYGIMIDTFRKLVVQHKLFKYKDFGFISDSEGNYILGNSKPNIIGSYSRFRENVPPKFS